MSNTQSIISQENERAMRIGEFLEFLVQTRTALRESKAAERDAAVELIREPLEDHYLDDRGQPAMYQRLESALYDDSR